MASQISAKLRLKRFYRVRRCLAAGYLLLVAGIGMIPIMWVRLCLLAISWICLRASAERAARQLRPLIDELNAIAKGNDAKNKSVSTTEINKIDTRKFDIRKLDIRKLDFRKLDIRKLDMKWFVCWG